MTLEFWGHGLNRNPALLLSIDRHRRALCARMTPSFRSPSGPCPGLGAAWAHYIARGRRCQLKVDRTALGAVPLRPRLASSSTSAMA